MQLLLVVTAAAALTAVQYRMYSPRTSSLSWLTTWVSPGSNKRAREYACSCGKTKRDKNSTAKTLLLFFFTNFLLLLLLLFAAVAVDVQVLLM